MPAELSQYDVLHDLEPHTGDRFEGRIHPGVHHHRLEQRDGGAAVPRVERGQDFVEDMNELWEDARPELVKQGLIEDSDATLGETVKTLLIQAAAQKAHDLTVNKKRIRKPKTQFRGV